MNRRYFTPLADAVASIKDYDERKRMAKIIGTICADCRNLDLFLWNRACQVSEEPPVEFYTRVRERVLRRDRTMIVWVKKEAVHANCDQRAEILETTEDLKNCDQRAKITEIVEDRENRVNIVVKLLSSGLYYNIQSNDIIGFEINDHLTIMRECQGSNYGK